MARCGTAHLDANIQGPHPVLSHQQQRGVAHCRRGGGGACGRCIVLTRHREAAGCVQPACHATTNQAHTAATVQTSARKQQGESVQPTVIEQPLQAVCPLGDGPRDRVQVEVDLQHRAGSIACCVADGLAWNRVAALASMPLQQLVPGCAIPLSVHCRKADAADPSGSHTQLPHTVAPRSAPAGWWAA